MAQVRDGGFTLIEVVLTLAISGSLAVLAFAGFNTINQQMQFSAAVERTKDFITAQRTEVLAGIQTNEDGDKRGTSDAVNLGRILTVKNGTVTVETVRMADTAAPSADEPVRHVDSGGNDLTFALPGGIAFDGEQRQVAFMRSPLDGTLVTFVSPAGGFARTDGSDYRYASFNATAAPGEAVSLKLADDAGRAALVVVDPKTNSISRIFE